MRRWKRYGRRRVKRRTAWTPGVSYGDLTQSEQVTFTTDTINGSQGAHYKFLTDATSLTDAGGEGSVVLRVVGRVYAFGFLAEATPKNVFLRWAIFRDMVAPDDSLVGISMWEPYGLGGENILAMGTILCDQMDVTLGSQQPLPMGTNIDCIDFDTSAKRRLSDDEQLFFGLTIAPDVEAASPNANSIRLSGYFRVLLQHA